jgi:hypothetical protein
MKKHELCHIFAVDMHFIKHEKGVSIAGIYQDGKASLSSVTDLENNRSLGKPKA